MNPPTAIRGPQSLRSASLRTMPRFPQSDHTTQINYSGMLSIISDQDVAILRLKDEVKELTARIQGLEELGSGVIPEQIEQAYKIVQASHKRENKLYDTTTKKPQKHSCACQNASDTAFYEFVEHAESASANSAKSGESSGTALLNTPGGYSRKKGTWLSKSLGMLAGKMNTYGFV